MLGKLTIVLKNDPEVAKAFDKWKGTYFPFGGRLVNSTRIKDIQHNKIVIGWEFDMCWPWTYKKALKYANGHATVFRGWARNA